MFEWFKNSREVKRRSIVGAVRRGVPQRSVARQFGVSLHTVQRWISRAGNERLDRVDWRDRPAGPRRVHNRTDRSSEDLVLSIRTEMQKSSDLGEYGAVAIRQEILRRELKPPATRTIGRILSRRGALDRHRRVRRTPPPAGWYLPDVASGRHELDSFDTVSGLVIRGGTEVVVLNGVSLHGGLISAWPRELLNTRVVGDLLLQRWRSFGLPDYAQFDNDTLFQGPHQHRDVIGRVMRLCLSLHITPVFAPPREPGFQAAIESLNGRWQAKVWARFEHRSLTELQHRSDRFVEAHRSRSASRIDGAPLRRIYPSDWVQDFQRHPSGTIIFIRRCNDQGAVSMLGRTFLVDPLWPHRLIRAEVALDAHLISFFALRRREPAVQPLLQQITYSLPHRVFHE